MKATKTIADQIQNALNIQKALLADQTLLDGIAQIAEAAVAVYRSGHKLLIAGNGGSAADAQHIAGELVNRFMFDRPALPAISLATDTSVMTAIGNDAGFDLLFARQIEALGAAGDMFIGISTSGKSSNIIRALEACRKKKIICAGLTGQDGAQMAELCDYCIKVPTRETPRIQEAHILIAHIFCGLVEDSLFKQNGV